MHTRAAAAPLCAWNKPNLGSGKSRVAQPDVCRAGVFAAQQASYVHVGPAKWQKPYVPPTPAHVALLSSEGKAAQRASSLRLRPPLSGRPAGGTEGEDKSSALAPVPEAEEPSAKSTK